MNVDSALIRFRRRFKFLIWASEVEARRGGRPGPGGGWKDGGPGRGGGGTPRKGLRRRGRTGLWSGGAYGCCADMLMGTITKESKREGLKQLRSVQVITDTNHVIDMGLGTFHALIVTYDNDNQTVRR